MLKFKDLHSMRRNIFSSIISITIALFSQAAFAHFHYELPITSTLQANSAHQLKSIKMSWTYDDEVSGMMLQDQKDIKKLGKKLITDLEKLGYFTFLKLNGKSIKTDKVKLFKLEEVKFKDYSKLKLTFTLPLKTPISLQGNNTLAIRHEDGTASAIIYYDKPSDLSIQSSLNGNCKTDIQEKKFEEGESPQTVKVVCKA